MVNALVKRLFAIVAGILVITSSEAYAQARVSAAGRYDEPVGPARRHHVS